MTGDIARATTLYILMRLNGFVRSGVSLSSAGRVARDTLFFVFEGGNSSKYRRHPHSALAAELESDKGKIYDHAIPLSVWLPELLRSGQLDEATLCAKLQRYYHIRIITEAEISQLNALGLRSRMPADWDGVEIEARYHKAAIEFLPPAA